ncbi:hypothetical protein MPTK2_4g02390 [Marchantia polymorpha subsp. ruderalis]
MRLARSQSPFRRIGVPSCRRWTWGKIRKKTYPWSFLMTTTAYGSMYNLVVESWHFGNSVVTSFAERHVHHDPKDPLERLYDGVDHAWTAIGIRIHVSGTSSASSFAVNASTSSSSI